MVKIRLDSETTINNLAVLIYPAITHILLILPSFYFFIFETSSRLKTITFETITLKAVVRPVIYITNIFSVSPPPHPTINTSKTLRTLVSLRSAEQLRPLGLDVMVKTPLHYIYIYTGSSGAGGIRGDVRVAQKMPNAIENPFGRVPDG